MNNTPPPSINETVVERFEAAWLRGDPKPVERLALDRNDPCYLATLEELVHLELEFAWKTAAEMARESVGAGQTSIPCRPKVEHYLVTFPELNTHDIALRLLQQEYLVRCQFGDRPSPQEYCQRFPEIVHTGDEIASAFPDRSQHTGASTAGELHPGQKVGRYTLIDEAGRGGFGRVWQVEDAKLGRRIALKQMSPHVARNEDLRRRFIAEARVSARLEHPGVVPVYDLDQLDEIHPYYTMKLVKGETLDGAIARFHQLRLPSAPTSHSLEFQKLLGVFVSICRTVEYAHAHNVIHRDLKPQNIILGDYGETIVLDWGLAKVFQPQTESAERGADSSIIASLDTGQTQPGSVQGTPIYMSPEQAGGRNDLVTPRTDIYALGVILYQLLTGTIPFAGHSTVEVLERVRQGRFASPRSLNPSVPKALEAVCLKAMATQPENRYALVRELREDVERYLADEPVNVFEESWGASIMRWGRHHRATVMATFVLLITAVVALSISTLVINHERIARQKALDVAQSEQRRRLQTKVDSLLSANPEAVPALLEELWQEEELVLPRLQDLRQSQDLSARERLRVDLALIRAEPTLRRSIQDRMLRAEVDEILGIRQALAAYREESIAELWPIASNEQEEDSVRLRASCALARLDPSSPNWDTVVRHVASALASQNPATIANWIDAFRPVGAALIPALQDIYQGEQNDTTHALLATILAEFGGDDVALLVDLVETSTPESFHHLIPKLEPHKNVAVPRLRQRLDAELQPDWNDSRDDHWAEPSAAVVRRIQEGQGTIHDRFAIAQSLPLDAFLKAAEDLRPCGYRPIRVRPYRGKDCLQTSALWTRDARKWRLAEGVTASEMERIHHQMEADGYIAEDLAGYVVDENGNRVDRFCGLWAERPEAGYRSVLVVGEKLGVAPRVTSDYLCRRLQEFFSAESELRYCGVYWRSQGAFQWHVIGGPAPGYRESGFETRLSPSHLLVDVSMVYRTAPKEPFDACAFYELGPLQGILSPESAKAFREGVEALFRGDTQLAVERLAIVSEAFELFYPAHNLLAITYAKRGDSAGATAALERRDRVVARMGNALDVLQSPQLKGTVTEALEIEPAFYRAMVNVYLGEGQKALNVFDEWLARFAHYDDVLFMGACVYSTAAGELAKQSVTPASSAGQLDRLQAYRSRAIELLARVAQLAPEDRMNQYLAHPLLDPIRETKEFQRLVDDDGFNRRYSAVWLPTLGYSLEFRELHGLTPEKHLEYCARLAQEQFRPRSLTVCVSPAGTAAAASVWHRPIVSEKARSSDASRKINAALALAHMGDANVISRFLGQQADPSMRAGLIHRLARAGVSGAVFASLADNVDPWVQQAMILAIGDSVSGAALPDGEDLITETLKQYRENPHPGVHSAADWLLRGRGQEQQLRQIDQEIQGLPPRGDRQWYVNTHGHTLAVVQGPVEFWMGSPGYEPGRMADELLHHRRISRTFAIATKETTAAQFRQFAPHFSYRQAYSPRDDTPIVDVNWYDAARYCRWLSEKEGLAEEQMCFPPLDEIGPEMRLPPDCLSRTGYRLPTEAEWEYACRAGSQAPYFFGEDIRLLSEYAWDVANSGGHGNPVGSRLPNGLGMFDMLGNVGELCLEMYFGYEYRLHGSIDDSPLLHPDGQRVVRGGSFISDYDGIRSARRFPGNRTEPYFDVGFRIARTLPEEWP